MKRLVLLILLSGGLVSAVLADAADDVKAVEQLQRTLNAAYLKQDAEAIKKLTGEDLVVVSSKGTRETRAEQLKRLPDLKFTAYVTEDVQVHLPAKDTAVVTFRTAVQGTFQGKPLNPRSAVVAVWVRRGGAWVEVFYQGTPLAAQ